MYPLCSSDTKTCFKIDPHIHTAEVSQCGFLPAADIVKRYHALGYDGIVITDHLHEDYISSLDCKDDWSACVKRFLYGYENAKTIGEQLGLKVLLGAEIRFLINDSDYLLYGIDEDFLYSAPYLYRHDPKDFFARYGDEVLIIQAHPFRGDNEILIKCIHGVEVFNTNPRHDNRNDKAQTLCNLYPHMHPFYGSDTHRDGDEGRAHMLINETVTDSHEFRDAVLRHNYKGAK
ncbi:MAG: PHP domain-containing protein [Defluviitaleaceae bacterium]|nr:PHP domain-containing protein [Defluviitaleaceae bacterium]